MLLKNEEQKGSGGQKQLRNNDFIERIEDELDDLTPYESFVSPSNGTHQKYYNLNEDQMLLVGMRESKIVRKGVLEWLKVLKDKTPKDFPSALRLAADNAERVQLAEARAAEQHKLIRHQHEELEHLGQDLGELSSKVDKIVHQDSQRYEMTSIGQVLGFDSPQKAHKFFNGIGVIKKIGADWKLTSKHFDKDYQIKLPIEKDGEILTTNKGKVITKWYWTPRGRAFLIEVYHKYYA